MVLVRGRTGGTAASGHRGLLPLGVTQRQWTVSNSLICMVAALGSREVPWGVLQNCSVLSGCLSGFISSELKAMITGACLGTRCNFFCTTAAY